MGCAPAGTQIGSGCSRDCSALKLLNQRLGNQGELTTDCQLFFETRVFTYQVTFSGFTQYRISRQEKGFLGFILIGNGMTILEAEYALPLYGPFI